MMLEARIKCIKPCGSCCKPEGVVGALDSFLAGLAGGGCPPARDEVEDGVHPAAALAGACRHQALRVPVLAQHSSLVRYTQHNAEAAAVQSCSCRQIYCYPCWRRPPTRHSAPLFCHSAAAWSSVSSAAGVAAAGWAFHARLLMPENWKLHWRIMSWRSCRGLYRWSPSCQKRKLYLCFFIWHHVVASVNPSAHSVQWQYLTGVNMQCQKRVSEMADRQTFILISLLMMRSYRADM